MAFEREKLKISTRSQYEVEDFASCFLHEFERDALKKPGMLSAERFARHIGAQVVLDYYSDGEVMGVYAVDAQTLRGADGNRIALPEDSILADRKFVEAEGFAAYNYTVMLLCCMRFFIGEEQPSEQLAFDLSGTQSSKNYILTTKDLSRYHVDGVDEEGLLRRADNLAQCLLMPKFTFKMEANTFLAKISLNRSTAAGRAEDALIEHIARVFNVPPVVALLRLKKNNYIY